MATITLEFRYIAIEYELWALGHMLDVIEPAMRRLAADDERKTFDELRSNGWDHDEAEVDLAVQDLSEKREVVLPRFMRGPFIVALWACFESGVQSVARTRQRENGVQVALTELKGDFLSRAKRYFDALLKLPLDLDKDRLAKLADLYQIRNAFAHANGLQEGMSESEWRQLREALRRSNLPPDEHRGFVVPSQAYVRDAYEVVGGCLQDLVARAR